MITFRLYTDVYHVLWNETRIGDLYREIDGFWVFSFEPSFSIHGALSEDFFIAIARRLVMLNKPWREQLEKELSPS